MDRFPLMLYRVPGTELIHGVKCQTLTVQDDEELEMAQGEGWCPTAPAAAEEWARVNASIEEQRTAERLAEALERENAIAAAIRAPLEAEVSRISKLLDACYLDAANQSAALKAEQDAHAATREQLAAAQADKSSAAPAPAAAKAKTK